VVRVVRGEGEDSSLPRASFDRQQTILYIIVHVFIFRFSLASAYGLGPYSITSRASRASMLSRRRI
jgi:hypothetical protein